MEVRQSDEILPDQFFPEGARWYGNRLWFGDIHAARVVSFGDNYLPRIEAQFRSNCSGIGFLDDGTPIASLMRERILARIEADGTYGVHADLSDTGCDHINDIVTDGKGRTYVDCLSYGMHWFEPERHSSGTLIHRIKNLAGETPDSVTDQIALVERDGTHRIVADNLLGPNGLAITGDGRYLIVAEWRANRLTRFRIDEKGSLVERAVFAHTEGIPDGICVDEEGAVWVASPTTNDCVRYRMGGEVLERVKGVGRRITSCVLGGADRRTLFLTTDEHPEIGKGRIEIARVTVPGAGYP